MPLARFQLDTFGLKKAPVFQQKIAGENDKLGLNVIKTN